MNALWIKNTSESDPHSYEVTEAVTNKAKKKLWGSNGVWTHDLHDTSAMLYQLSYMYKPCWKQVKCEFNLYSLEWHDVTFQFGFRTHTTALWPMEQSSIISAKFNCPCSSLPEFFPFTYYPWLWKWLE